MGLSPDWGGHMETALSYDFHGLPAERFPALYDHWTERGRTPVTLSPSLRNGRVYMAGSLQPGPIRPVSFLVPADHYEFQLAAMRGWGLRPAQVTIRKTGEGLRFTAIWIEAEGPFESRWGMGPAEFHARWRLLRAQGYLTTDLDAYQDGGLRFAATWVKRDFQDCATYFGMTGAQYQRRSRRLGREGLQPTCFVAYPDAGDMYYAAVWEQVPGEWLHRFGLTGEEYRQQHEEQAARGFRLHQIFAYGSRYSAIWRKP
jgi:hypothetical protein